MRTIALLPALLALAACGKSDNDPGPGGVTVGEAKALDEAADMIEKQRMPSEALRAGSPTQASPQAPAAAPAK